MNFKTLTPFVYWAQTDKTVHLKVDLIDVEDSDVNFTATSLKFYGRGTGAQGDNRYEFSLNFYDDIEVNESRCKITDNNVSFVIVKSKVEWWPRLISQLQKPHWLKIDFDRWQSPEDLSEEKVGDIMTDHPDVRDKLHKEEKGYKKESWRTIYLASYNFIMFLTFLYICVVMGVKVFKEGTGFFPKTYETLRPAMLFAVAAQAMEVVHPIVGLMKGGVLFPFIQVFGRYFIMFLMLEQEPRVQVAPQVFSLFFGWSIIETVRYPYYICQLYKKDNAVLSWLRYHAWMPLYPLGYYSEAMVCYLNLQYMDESQKWSLKMPNPINFTFCFSYFLRIHILCVMTPGFFMLMKHMFKTRQQKYGGKVKTK